MPVDLLKSEGLLHLEIKTEKGKNIPPSLKGELQQLENLDYLSLSNASSDSNFFTSDFFSFRRLRVLKLKNCHLNKLPEGLVHMPKLEMLDLSYNQLVELPVWPQTLPCLHSLNLGNNLFHTLPPSLLQMKGLRRLGLDFNQLSSFSPEELTFLAQLIHLSLDGNSFSEEEQGKITSALGVWF